jgi:hypothetical protein
LDDRVRRIGKDLGGTVAASYYREGIRRRRSLFSARRSTPDS